MPKVVRFNVTPVKSTRLHHPEENPARSRRRTRRRPRVLFVDGDGKRFSGATKAPTLPRRRRVRRRARPPRAHAPERRRDRGPPTATDERGWSWISTAGRSACIVDGGFEEALSDYAGTSAAPRPARPSGRGARRPTGDARCRSVGRRARSSRTPRRRALAGAVPDDVGDRGRRLAPRGGHVALAPGARRRRRRADQGPVPAARDERSTP